MKKRPVRRSKVNKTAIFVCVLMTAVTVLLSVSTLVSCASKSSAGDSDYIKITKGGEKIKAEIPIEKTDAEEVGLFAIDPWQNASAISSMEPVAKAKIKGDTVKAELEINGSVAEAVSKGYLFAVKSSGGYTPITGVYYVTNPGDIHGKEGKKPETGFKGAIGNEAQLLELGATSTIIDVCIGDLMSPMGGEGSLPYVWNGLTYYASRSAVEALDKKIRDYTSAGMYIYLRLVQTTDQAQLSGGVKETVFASIPEKKGYAFNMTNREGSDRICGMFNFLAERYALGGENGKASAFIIGDCVNNFKDSYAGGPALEHGITNYVKAVRAAYNILLANTPEGRVYVSFGNNWNVSDTGNYNVKDMLAAFNNLASAEGDFYWQVAVEANASDASDSSIWDDPLTGNRPDFISPANLEILSDQLYTEMYKCGGKIRRMIVSRFEVGGANEDERAASYAYAYYKCLSIGYVDSLIYGKTADSETDKVKSGLLSVPGVSGKAEAKRIAEVFSFIDDKRGGDLSFVSGLIGDKWNRIHDKHSKEAVLRQVIVASGSDKHSRNDMKVITDFTDGSTCGFSPAVSAAYSELRYSTAWNKPALYTVLAPKDTSDKSGVISSQITLKDISDAGYLGLTLMAETSGQKAEVVLRLSGYDKNGIEQIYEAKTSVDPNVWAEVYFDIREFVDNTDEDTLRMAILVSPESAGTRASGLWVSRIITEAPEKSIVPIVIAIVLAILAVVAGVAAFVIWFKKNYTFVRE